MTEQFAVGVDSDLCVGHGQCFARAPEVFEPDEDGFCMTTMVEVDAPRVSTARAGADACPERAIVVTPISI